MLFKKLGQVKKYNLAMTFFVVTIFVILIINLISLNIFSFDDDEVTKIRYADNISQTHQELIEMFNAKYKGEIEVIPVDLPFTKFSTNERKELLVRSLRGKNNEIDVFATDQIWVSRFSKWAEPLNQYFSQQERNNILPSAYSTCIIDSQLVSLPMYIDFGLLCYRKDLLEELNNSNDIQKKLENSISWQDFIRLGKKWNQDHADNLFYLFSGDNEEGLICSYLEILYSKGGKYNPKDENDLLKEPKLEALQFIKNLIYKHKLTPKKISQFKEVEGYRYAMQKDIPFFRAWSSNLKDTLIFGEYSDKLDKLKFAPLPHFSKGSSKSVFGGWNLMISRFSKNKKAAIKFLKFIVSERAQKFLYENAYYMPVISSFYNNVERSEETPFEMFTLIMDNYGFHRPKYENYTRISNVVSYYVSNALKDEHISPGEALKMAEQSIRSGEIILE
ncbi:MAG: extracellular solute-binding protein [Candidatus Marinimicrobia bacterium]|nr:extracellular solute-binding protein [Candidatus Neomarinimicrobiota bacterium]